MSFKKDQVSDLLRLHSTPTSSTSKILIFSLSFFHVEQEKSSHRPKFKSEVYFEVFAGDGILLPVLLFIDF